MALGIGFKWKLFWSPLVFLLFFIEFTHSFAISVFKVVPGLLSMSTFKNPICGDWNRRTIKSRREKKQTLWRRTERAKASFIVTLIRDAWLCVEMTMRCNLYYFFGSPEHWRRRDCHLRCSLRRSSRRALCASKHLWVGQTGVETVWVGCKQKPGAISSHFNWKLLPVRRILQKAFISIESYCRSVVFWGRIPGGLPPSCWDTSPGFRSG